MTSVFLQKILMTFDLRYYPIRHLCKTCHIQQIIFRAKSVYCKVICGPTCEDWILISEYVNPSGDWGTSEEMPDIYPKLNPKKNRIREIMRYRRDRRMDGCTMKCTTWKHNELRCLAMDVSWTEPKHKPSIFSCFPRTKQPSLHHITGVSRFTASCGHYDQRGLLEHTDADNGIFPLRYAALVIIRQK